MNQPLMISIAAAGETLSLGRTTVFKLIRERRLRTIKIGNRRLISYESVRALAGSE